MARFISTMSVLLILFCHVLYVTLKPQSLHQPYREHDQKEDDRNTMDSLFDSNGTLRGKSISKNGPTVGKTTFQSWLDDLEGPEVVHSHSVPHFNFRASSDSHFFLTSIYRHKENSHNIQHYPVLPEHLQNAEDLRPLLTGTFGADQESGVYDRYGQPLSLFTLSKLPRDSVASMGLKETHELPPLLPDPTDRNTVLNLAKMSYNDYYRPNDTKNHYPVDPFYEVSDHHPVLILFSF